MKRLVFLFFLLPLSALTQVEVLTKEWKKDKELRHASIGFCVMKASDSSPLAEYNSETALVPASTLKVITTSAALGLLGPAYRFETRIGYTGSFDAGTGVIDGDLIIFGSGDPSLQSEHFYPKTESLTDAWAKTLKQKGVRSITGAVVGYAGSYPRQVPDQWIWGDIGNYFGAVPCALNFMDNKFVIRLSGGENGHVSKVLSVSPVYKHRNISITASVAAKGNSDQAYVYGDPFGWEKHIKGNIPVKRNPFEIEAALPDPALLCAETLNQSLKTLGIVCGKNARSDYSAKAPDITSLYSHYSQPLSKLIYHTNQTSDNLYCESMLRTLGKGDIQAGIDAVTAFWKSRGLNTDEAFMTDGSGLSRASSLTPHFQTALLCKIYRDSNNYKIINASLPAAGLQGSMASVGRGSFLQNNLRAKTGYLTRVRAYCGYVKTKRGEDLAFSIIFNNFNCSPARARLEIEKWMLAIADL